MEQFTKEEAKIINEWANISESYNSVKKDIIPIAAILATPIPKFFKGTNSAVELSGEDSRTMSPTPAAAFEVMSEKKYKTKIDKLETELQGSKDYSRALAVSGRGANAENTALRMENVDLRDKFTNLQSRFDNVSDGFKALLEQLAEAKKELKYSNQIIDNFIKVNSMCDFSNLDELIFKATDFINNKLF